MWKKWFPWRWILTKVAQKQGFLDPVAFISKLQRFSQPSEVVAPIELIRLATVLQARGFLNVQAIQHNLDWIWPYWVVRQFDPRDVSFIIRAFSLTHINLTHRNWTGLGIPDFSHYPLVDPRGLLTPFYDSWSVDIWIIRRNGKDLLPSKTATVSQKLDFDISPQVVTHFEQEDQRLELRASMETEHKRPLLVLEVEAWAVEVSWLVVSLRPYNPEGVSEVQHIKTLSDTAGWEVNKKQKIYFNEHPAHCFFSNYQEGDVYSKLKKSFPAFHEDPVQTETQCSAGMATAAAVFKMNGEQTRSLAVQIPLPRKDVKEPEQFISYQRSEAAQGWKSALQAHSKLRVADSQVEYLYETALRALILYSPGTEIFAGPYTYKHFWFRDACFVLHAFLSANLHDRSEKILDAFRSRQTSSGYFRSQDGEWDSNGQVLWVFRRFCELSRMPPKESWKESLRQGAEWIIKKRLSWDIDAPHAGLFPSGFSAEHLGPNDYYYWDNFWGIEGLHSASLLMKYYGEQALVKKYAEAAKDFQRAVEKSLAQTAIKLGTKAMPSSPYRRLDTASIGSLTVGYPLSLWAPDDRRVMETVEYLLSHHFINGGFFHEMSHSGINPYLTLSVAQVLLRNDDPRYADILKSIQKLASPTGQWPEAIHPQVLSGCMGDGQHPWASAEWILMIKNCFVREESDRLILGSGVFPEWYNKSQSAVLENVPTPYGLINVRIDQGDKDIRVSWEMERDQEHSPDIQIKLPGYHPVRAKKHINHVLIPKKEAL